MEWLQDKVNTRGKGKTSTDSGAATRAPLAPGIDPGGAAARGQSAELIDENIAAGFAQGVAGMKGASPAQRQADEARVAAEINVTLQRSGVPPVQVIFERRPAGKGGMFAARTWSLHINLAQFHDPRKRVAMLGTVYHEARHAEQYFDAIRVAARLYPGKSARHLADWIAGRGAYVPPLAIIEAARQRPAAPGEGDKWFAFYFGEDATTHRDARALSKYMGAKGRALNAELAQLQAQRDTMRREGHDLQPHVITEFRARYKRTWPQITKAFEAYEALADEVDANKAKNMAIDAIMETP